MTGGRVVILGPTGRNMAAGMSGGIAYVLDLDPRGREPGDGEAPATRPGRPRLVVRRGHPAPPVDRFRGGGVGARDWPRRSALFTKVMPVDYQRVLDATRIAKAEGLDVDTAIMEAARADPQGFLHIVKKEARKRPVAERVHDWHEVYAPQSPAERAAEVSEQAARCMDCGIPFCHSGSAGCPLGNLIPEWNDLVRRGRWSAASERLHATNNFPEFTGAGVSGAVRVGVCARPRRHAHDRQRHHQADRTGHR